MSLPREGLRSLRETQRFLADLTIGTYPRVPKSVRMIALSLLRHYPASRLSLREALECWRDERMNA